MFMTPILLQTVKALTDENDESSNDEVRKETAALLAALGPSR